MQLRPKSIRQGLAQATYTLLSSSALVAHAESTDGTRVDGGALFYSEKDRVQIFEPVLQSIFTLGEDETLTVRGVIDIMSGASPSGAAPSSVAQTFTSPSGGSSSVVPAGQLPLQEFSDERLALSVDWDFPTTQTQKNLFGASLSRENDYISLGASDTLRTDFNDRMTTLSLGVAGNIDGVKPICGAPPALTNVTSIVTCASGGGGSGGGDDDDEREDEGFGELKTSGSALVGITQVINRRLLMQFNYSASHTRGYLNDPYKMISEVNSAGLPVAYYTEKRPRKRTTQSLYWKGVLHLPQDVVHLSYRYFRDDWGVRAHTTDLEYRLELGESHFLRPHLRYHVQSGANFYRHSLIDTQSLPAFASADYRLAPMTSYTVGLRYGYRLSSSTQFGLRVERILQTGDHHPTSAVGAQKNVDLYPNLEVYTVLVDFSTKF